MTLGERLSKAMAHAGFKTDQDLVDTIDHTLGIFPNTKPFTSQQAISKIKGNKLKTERTHLIPYLANECEVSAIWLAAEVGPMIRIQSGKRFEPEHVAMLNNFLTLPKDIRFHIVGIINAAYSISNEQHVDEQGLHPAHPTMQRR